jgi:hypothetical protein
VPVPDGIHFTNNNHKDDKKPARNPSIATVIVAAPHFDGKGDNSKIGAAWLPRLLR